MFMLRLLFIFFYYALVFRFLSIPLHFFQYCKDRFPESYTLSILHIIPRIYCTDLMHITTKIKTYLYPQRKFNKTNVAIKKNQFTSLFNLYHLNRNS